MKCFFRGAVLLLALFVSLVAYSHPISGIIVDSEGSPVESAVVVLQNTDSIYLLSTTTDSSGYFKLETDVSSYLLIIRHLIYEQKSIVDSVSDLGTIVLNDKLTELDEVVVKDKKKVMQVADNGAMQFDAKLLALDKPVTSAIDLVEQVPLVQRKGDEFRVVGTMSEATIILNGRKNHMSIDQLKTMLESMPASQVKNIEVFYDTPLRYGVKGPSINVVLEKKRSDKVSLRGDVYAKASQKYYFGGAGGTNWSLAGEKWSLFTTYMYSESKHKETDELDSYHWMRDSLYHVLLSTNSVTKVRSHSGTALFEVDFNDDASLELQYSGDFYEGKIKSTASLLVDSLMSESFIASPNMDHTNTFSAEFAKDNLAIGGSFLCFSLDNDQEMANSDKSGFVSNSKQSATDYRVYFDNANEFSAGTLSYGIDADMSHTKNTYGEIIDGVHDIEKTTLNEVELSAYAGWGVSMEKGELNLSCKLEYSRSDMETDVDKVNLWNKFSLIPDLTYTYSINDNNSINLSLTGEKVYPSYWDNNNSKIYQNSYLSIDGNPELKPYLVYLLNAEYIIHDKYVLGVMEEYCPKIFSQLLYMQLDTLQAFYKCYNFDYQNSLGAVVTVPVDWNSRICRVLCQWHS